MDAGAVMRRARLRGGLTLRALADRAGTSHAALSAYERGAKVPRVDTLDRILRAAGFDASIDLEPRPLGEDEAAKSAELVDVLLLAEQFPSRPARELQFPVFR